MPLSRISPLAAAISALALATPALAADYNPPIYIEKAPEWVPVEIGSGWYLRGDVSYNVGNPVYDFEGVENRRFGGSIGVGHHFTENLRGDLNIGYVGSDRISVAGELDDEPFAFDASHTVWSGLANAYLDLGTIVGITPYIGAGAGVTYSRHEVSVEAFGESAELADRQYSFAYALNAGVSYAMTDNVSVDVGYQYLNTPRMEYLNTDTGEIERGTDYHQVRLGLRYNLW